MRIKERLRQIGERLPIDIDGKEWRRKRRRYKRWKKASKNRWARRLQALNSGALARVPIRAIAALGILSVTVGWLVLVGLTLSKVHHFYGGGQDLYLAGATIALMAEGVVGVILAGMGS